MANDLRFVREAVEEHHQQQGRPKSIIIMWAVYVLIGYSLIDLHPAWAGWFFMIGGWGGGMISWWVGRRFMKSTGQINRRLERRTLLHWFVGFLLIFASLTGLAMEHPALRGPLGSQCIVLMIGLIYFTYGIHVPAARYLIWAGPILMLGGVLVGLVPHYGWTALGVLIAAMILSGLLVRPKTVAVNI
ncbi:MAG TPA: hypothetical protein VL992_10250 [Tepidisphaeraceae bacterium]|nr:hypothetical protein [Tepidisphaeraceae bacterium]